MKNPLGPVFINNLFFKALGMLGALFVLAHIWKFLFLIALVLLLLFLSVLVLDVIMLFGRLPKKAIVAKRIVSERFSNGDPNEVILEIESLFSYEVRVEVIDEVPVQFQKRDFLQKFRLKPGQLFRLTYSLVPVTRGEFVFGALHVFVATPVGLLARRYSFNREVMVKVYPSYMQMRKYELMAISNRLSEVGIKKIRRIGRHMEFDQIRDYIKGDDIRTINWKATARKGHIMVNQYQDEKSQQVFCVVDMGRSMQMPFNGMTLLDYAINTSLVISNIAMQKHDKAGLITFNDKVCSMLPARREGHHMQSIMEVLYNQTTGFLEHNLEALFARVKHQIHHRSLLILFTNFESLKSAERELPMLARLAANHLLLVVFFENTGLEQVITNQADDTEEIYIQAIAEKFIFDKKRIVKELERHGIHAILTDPGKLTVDTMNRYLELKARGVL
jgi:uncharacterized protein (DUF58 family)